MSLFRETVTILRNDRADKKLTHRVKADLYLQSAKSGVPASAVDAITFLSSEEAKRLLASIAGVRSVLVEPPPSGATNKSIREGVEITCRFDIPVEAVDLGKLRLALTVVRRQHRQGPGAAGERGLRVQGAGRRRRRRTQEPGRSGARTRASASRARAGLRPGLTWKPGVQP